MPRDKFLEELIGFQKYLEALVEYGKQRSIHHREISDGKECQGGTEKGKGCPYCKYLHGRRLEEKQGN